MQISNWLKLRGPIFHFWTIFVLTTSYCHFKLVFSKRLSNACEHYMRRWRDTDCPSDCVITAWRHVFCATSLSWQFNEWHQRRWDDSHGTWMHNCINASANTRPHTYSSCAGLLRLTLIISMSKICIWQSVVHMGDRRCEGKRVTFLPRLTLKIKNDVSIRCSSSIPFQ